MISYIIGQILQNNNYCLEINNGELYTEIDFVNAYSGYRFINSKGDKVFFVAVGKINSTARNAGVIKGDIIEYDLCDIKTRNIKYVNVNNILYKKATQYEYDRYEYLIGNKNDNAKLYKFIYDLIIRYNKEEYIKSLNKKIKETPFISERNVLVI